jgi:hypothetical protein
MKPVLSGFLNVPEGFETEELTMLLFPDFHVSVSVQKKKIYAS